jgi:hypothetical protein
MHGNDLRIKKLTNGYSLYFRDPEIVKANQSRDLSTKPTNKPYRDPEREMAFKNVKELTTFLNANLEKMCAADDYETSFSKAVMESEDDD